ncbi:STAS domain-containing protein [uncultured Luteimonas sp.]|uniref:STAS domain-containing protein n=1 Tax=uncultured Luteimonas sp. TaxID=453144 RepID=UPI002635E343|nr:STAS domain-containing protein [uncultured Luteimonas sp.]
MPDAASVRRDGSALAFAGALSRDAVAALWPQSLALVAGVERFDLSAVSRVDSAGLALLVELAQRGGAVSVTGDPPGLDGLRRAYRLSPTLNFARA